MEDTWADDGTRLRVLFVTDGVFQGQRVAKLNQATQ